jgi:hypothetical protein
LEKEQNLRSSSLQPEKNDLVKSAITGDSEQSGMDLPQLYEDFPYKNYINGLAVAFMD